MCISLKFTFLCIEEKSFPGKCFLVRSLVVRRKMFSVPGSRCLTSFLWYMFITRQFPCIFCHLQSNCNTTVFIWKIHFLCRKTSSHPPPARLQSFITISISFLIASTRNSFISVSPHISFRPTHMWLNSTSFVSIYFRHFELDGSIERREAKRVDKRRDEILIKKMGRKSLLAVSGLFHPGLISIAGGVTWELCTNWVGTSVIVACYRGALWLN